jgi:hypothetical protein
MGVVDLELTMNILASLDSEGVQDRFVKHSSPVYF